MNNSEKMHAAGTIGC